MKHHKQNATTNNNNATTMTTNKNYHQIPKQSYNPKKSKKQTLKNANKPYQWFHFHYKKKLIYLRTKSVCNSKNP